MFANQRLGRKQNLKPIRIGSRGSKLALWQAEWVIQQLSRLSVATELVIISTSGDASAAPLGQIGGQGVFTKEIQLSLLDGRIDVAVHSLKDLPTLPVEGLALAAVPIREDTADCLISRDGTFFEDLPAGSRVGTGSTRRAAQLRAWRSGVEIVEIRGNVDSRMRKLDEGQYDAIVLAKAGLSRLNLLDRVTQQLPEQRIFPAVGQGALGLECRQDDLPTGQALAQLNHSGSHAEVVAERQLLRCLQAGCLAPIGARATATHGLLSIKARVLSLDGSQVMEAELTGSPDDPEGLGQRLAMQLLDQGAADLIDRSK